MLNSTDPTWFNTVVSPTQYKFDGGGTSDNNNQAVNDATNLAGLGDYQQSGTNSGLSWIDQALKSAQSTDDPGYWYSHIQNDPKAMSGDQSAINYWIGRINQGNGALSVRQGLTPLFQDSGSQNNGLQGLGISDDSLNSLNTTLQDFMKQQNTVPNTTWTGSQAAKPQYGTGNQMSSMNPSTMNNSNSNYGYTTGLKSLGYGG